MKIVDVLGLDKDEAEQLYDCAGKAQNTIPYDLPEYIMDRDYVAAAFVPRKTSMQEKNNGKNL